MDSIDKLLSELQAEYQQSVNSPVKKTEEGKKGKKGKKVKKVKLDSPAPSSFFASSPSKGDAIDNILAEIKQETEEKQLLEEQQKQQKLEEERIEKEKIKANNLEALKRKAQDWLNKLEPLSPEGIWFESFSKNYPSKLEAAIEYLNSEQ
ncbi:salt stress protein, Slr1339 family [Rivularia sp. PCC 7116]|uniref:salt stress protein, Slr1339 family n=1 Tax=Rivularia sp. PCC 7116 TaxID=373994 RepID=UPI000319FC60|nr:hypothetical protein [Rivularia sp. PCC 7116]